MNQQDATFIRRAIELAKYGMDHDAGGPFGAVIVKDGKIIAEGWNTVTSSNDPTAHAEVNVIRKACQELSDFQLKGCTLYTSCEPCPMCMAALHWARVGTVMFGATIADAESAGFNELRVPAADVLKIGGSSVRLESGLLSAECRQLFREWKDRPDRVVY